jgi:pyruvate,water dikinase
MFLETLSEARVMLQIREDTHYNATLVLPIFRRIFLEMGSRLVRAGVIAAPVDIFHLRLDELQQVNGDAIPFPEEQAAALREAILRRKQARAALESTPIVDPRMFPHRQPAGDALLNGMPGSPGIVEGPVRIIRDPAEFERLVAGEVLVAPFTNPSWTPLFQRAAAVIVDSGSAASHAAIVAREYGIPAVMSTVTGTQVLHDGERVRVDGSRGLVYRVPAAQTDGESDNPAD